MIQLRAKFQTNCYSCGSQDLFWVTNLSDGRRVSTANFLHVMYVDVLYTKDSQLKPLCGDWNL